MRPRGKHSKVSAEELQQIIEMKKTIPAKQIARMLKRSICVIVYADKPKPEPEPKVNEEYFNYQEHENWIV
jgi:hypothetical protein